MGSENSQEIRAHLRFNKDRYIPPGKEAEYVQGFRDSLEAAFGQIDHLKVEENGPQKTQPIPEGRINKSKETGTFYLEDSNQFSLHPMTAQEKQRIKENLKRIQKPEAKPSPMTAEERQKATQEILEMAERERAANKESVQSPKPSAVRKKLNDEILKTAEREAAANIEKANTPKPSRIGRGRTPRLAA